MITKQHTAILFLALANIRKNEEFRKLIPWILLPDAMRAYVGSRQPSHFEEHPSRKDTSWMIFPSKAELKKLSKESAMKVINFHKAENIPKCVIGEQTHIKVFDWLNSNHEFYHALRAHLRQDGVLYVLLSEVMVDVSQRFFDVFTIRHSGEQINGQELRNQIDLFGELGFIKLAGMVYGETGILLDRDWFDEYVYESLKIAYPSDLLDNTYRYMKIDEDVNKRLHSLQFELTEEEKSSVKIVKNIERILRILYSEALTATEIELVLV